MIRPKLMYAGLGIVFVLVIIIGHWANNWQQRQQQENLASATRAATAASTELAATQATLAKLETWSYQSKPDEMITNGTDSSASIISTNEVNFRFPYDGSQSADLVVRRNAETVSPKSNSFPYDVFISIDRGQLLSGDQGDIEVKFDNDAPMTFQADSSNDGDSTVLFFNDNPDTKFIKGKHGHDTFVNIYPLKAFLDKLQSSKVLKIKVSVYQNGDQVFVFNVAGFKLDKLSATPTNQTPSPTT